MQNKWLLCLLDILIANSILISVRYHTITAKQYAASCSPACFTVMCRYISEDVAGHAMKKLCTVMDGNAWGS